jgi:polyphosphate kinase 2 (PPK2 family)
MSSVDLAFYNQAAATDTTRATFICSKPLNSAARCPKRCIAPGPPRLRTDLLDAQRRLRDEARIAPSSSFFAGVDGAGKSENGASPQRMDGSALARDDGLGEPSDEELERPEFWRYWRALPPRGRVGFYLSSWYSGPLLDRVYRRIKPAEFDDRLNRIAQFEHALAEDGALILKFWMHLSRGAHRKRLKKLENDPLTRWRVNKLQWRHWQMRNKFIVAAERIIERTSTGRAPWTIVEGLDARYRTMTIVTAIRDAIRGRLSAAPPPREESESSSAGRLRAEGASASSAESLGGGQSASERGWGPREH